MRVHHVFAQSLWAVFVALPFCCMGQQHTADPSEAITLTDKPVELAQRLVELSHSRFDLQCKAFGVHEVLEGLDLAHRLQMAAARLEDDEEAELAADEALLGQLEQISAAVEQRCQGKTAPIIDRELMRCRVQEAAARVARHAGDKPREIECRRKTVAAAAELRRALMVAYEAGVLPWNDMLRLSRHSCQAAITLIDLTIDDSTQAMKGRAAVLEELLDLAEEVLEARQEAFKHGLASSDEVDLVQVERFRIAACLARERGNREEELRAVQGIVDAQSRRLNRATKLYETGTGAHCEHEKVEWECEVARAELTEARARHESGGATRDQERLILVHIQMARCRQLEAELQQAQRDLVIRKSLHQTGACDELAVVEAMASRQLARISLKQGHLDLARLQKNL